MQCPKCGYQTNETICPLCRTQIVPVYPNYPPQPQQTGFQQFQNPSGRKNQETRALETTMVVIGILLAIFVVLPIASFFLFIIAALLSI